LAKLQTINPTSSADFLVTIEGLPDTYFSTFSGITETFTRAEFADGLSAKKRKAQTGSSMVEDCELSKPFDPDLDGALFTWLDTRRDGTYFQVLVRPVRRSKEVEFRGTKAFRLANCRLMSASYPGNVDSAGGDTVSVVNFKFSVEEATFS
jgi:hypothetical protein